MRLRTLYALTFGLATAFLCCAPCQADALQALRAADRAVAQGHVVYRLDARSAPLPLPTAPPDKPELGSVRARSSLTESLTYDGRGHTRLDRLDLGDAPEGPQGPRTQLWDGNTAQWVDGNQLEISHTPPHNTGDPAACFSSLTPSPCLPLGRGLSSLQGLRLQARGSRLLVSGIAPYDVRVEAVVDPHHGHIARSVRMSAQRAGRWSARWEYGTPRLVPPGVWLPSRATVVLYNSRGLQEVRNTYTLLQADFRAPNPRSFRVALGGKDITDLRSVGLVRYRKGPPLGVQTAEELLPYTEQEARRWSREQQDALRRRALASRWRLVLGALLSTCVALSVWLAWSQRRRGGGR